MHKDQKLGRIFEPLPPASQLPFLLKSWLSSSHQTSELFPHLKGDSDLLSPKCSLLQQKPHSQSIRFPSQQKYLSYRGISREDLAAVPKYTNWITQEVLSNPSMNYELALVNLD